MSGRGDLTLTALREQRMVLLKATESCPIPLSEHRLRSGPREGIFWEISSAGNTAGKIINDDRYHLESVTRTGHRTSEVCHA